MDIKTDIRNFILDNFMMGKNPEQLTDSDSLLEIGIIDSTGVLELVNFIEENFGFAIEDDELVPENLDSVDQLVKFIDRKRRQ